MLQELMHFICSEKYTKLFFLCFYLKTGVCQLSHVAVTTVELAG